MKTNYKVLTLWEPWATLLVHGIKKIETRPWPMSWTVEKGTYLIHAAKKWTHEQDKLCTYNEYFRKALNEITNCIKIGVPYWQHHFNLGHIIGSVEITECCEIKQSIYTGIPYINSKISKYAYDDIQEPELSFGDYKSGRYAWLTQNPRVLKNPIPYKGGQGYYQNFKGDVKQLIFES